jgi:hypothetical protein
LGEILATKGLAAVSYGLDDKSFSGLEERSSGRSNEGKLFWGEKAPGLRSTAFK